MVVETCRGCERYHVPPKSWKSFEFGSKELLIFLLDKNKSLKKVNIIDSSFASFEPTSKKIKIEIVSLTDFVEQTLSVEYSIRNKQCADCMRAEAKQYWRASVQVRQKPHHQRTFIYLEQLIKAHRAHLNANKIAERSDGIDFFFADRGGAQKLVNFIGNFYGIKVVNSEQLISEDRKNNTANKKYTFSVSIVPFCVDDLVLCNFRGYGSGRVLVVKKVGHTIVFHDVENDKVYNMNVKEYFKNEKDFKIAMRSGEFRHYRVVFSRERPDGVFEATITEDEIVFYEVRTRVRINDEDVVCGYDVKNTNIAVELNCFEDIIICRVFEDTVKDIISDRMLANEYNYFIQDNHRNKELMAGLAVYNPKNKTVEDILNMKL